MSSVVSTLWRQRSPLLRLGAAAAAPVSGCARLPTATAAATAAVAQRAAGVHVQCIGAASRFSSTTAAPAAASVGAETDGRWSSGVTAAATAAAAAAVAAASVAVVACEEDDTGGEGSSEDSSSGKKKRKGFKERTIARYEDRIRAFSTPDKVFRYFASVRVDGDVYMRPCDFIRAVTPGELQPKNVGLDLFDDKPSSYGLVHPKNLNGTLFRHSDDGAMPCSDGMGLLSYAEFLFLLTLLAAPPRQFELAFKMFDVDGNGTVDVNEFADVQAAVQRNTPTGRRMHTMDRTSLSSESIGRSYIMQRLFGRDGQGKCDFDKFQKFFEEVQRDVLHIDFLRHKSNPDSPTMTELDLARMLLKYTRLKEREHEQYMDRVRAAQHRVQISWEEVANLFTCLRAIDDLGMALSFFSTSGTGITQDEFRRACRATSGVELSDNVIQFIFHMFDKDADGTLADSEFLEVMQDAHARGLNKEKDLPLGRGWNALVKCIKIQLTRNED